MAQLATKDGKLLVKNGKLVLGDCECDCYYYGGALCPNCCIYIDWGTFNDDGDLEVEGTDTVFTLVMPTKNSRVVCDGEQVTARMVFALGMSPGTTDFGPYANWDRSWKYVSHTPAVDGSCGIVFKDGLIEWCELNDASGIEDTYEVVLEYDHCWADHGAQYGDIEFGDRLSEEFQLITGSFCDSFECCEPEVDCEPCCFYIGGEFEEDDAGDAVFWGNNENGDLIKVTVSGSDPVKNTLCVEDGIEISMEIKLIPRQYSGVPWLPEVNLLGDGWERQSHSPAVGTGTVDDGPSVSIEWGPEISAVEYSAMIAVTCPNLPGPVTVAFSNNSQNLPDSGGVVIEFICCDGSGECDDCYPDPDTGFMHCMVDMSSTAYEPDENFLLSDYPGSANEPDALVEWEVIAVWENWCCNETKPEGNRFVHYLFRCCSFEYACDSGDAEAAFSDYVNSAFPLASLAACNLATPSISPAVSVQDIIDDTEGELDGEGVEGTLEVYYQDDDITCPECPE